MDFLEECADLESEIERFAACLEVAQPSLIVPTCPDWTVADLARHLGTIHRWAEYLIAHQAQRPVSQAVLEIDESIAADATWIRDGGEALLSTLRGADPDSPMWAWGPDQRVAFWSRRQLHETIVHRCDLEITSHVTPQIDAPIAADTIDEFLANLAAAAAFSPLVASLRGNGESLVFQTTDTERAWTAILQPETFEIRSGSRKAEASVIGPAAHLALFLYRRLPLHESDLSVTGNNELLEFWMERSGLQ